MRQTREMSPQDSGSNDPQAPGIKIYRIAIRIYQREQDSVVSVFQNGPFDFPLRSPIWPQIGNSAVPLPQNDASDVICWRQLPQAAQPARPRSPPEFTRFRDEVPLEAFSEDHVNYENVSFHTCTELCSDFEHSLASEPLRGYPCRFALSPHFDTLSQL